MIYEEMKQTVELVGKTFNTFLESVCLLADELRSINLIQAGQLGREAEKTEKNTRTENASTEQMAEKTGLKEMETTKEASGSKTDNEGADRAGKQLTKEEVRVVLSRVAKAGFRQEVKDLLSKYNASNLREVDEKDYAALVAEAEGLING